jgi:hypothetical protein
MSMGAISRAALFGYQHCIGLSEFLCLQAIKSIFQPDGSTLTIRLIFSHALASDLGTSTRLG